MVSMSAVMTIVLVSVSIVVAVAVLAQLYPVLTNFACPAQGTGESSLQGAIREGCEIFSQFGGIILIVLPILAAAGILFAYFRSWGGATT